MQAEAAAVRRGVLASRIVRAGLRAGERKLDEYDADALKTLISLLVAYAGPDAQTTGYDVFAFAAATHSAAPARHSRQARHFAEDIQDVTADARLLLALVTAPARLRARMYDDELSGAAQRLVERYAAVSDQEMSEVGGAGDSLNGVNR